MRPAASPGAAPASSPASSATKSLTEAFYRAAATAGYAPSVHNRQPWRWRLSSDTLDLHLEPGRLRDVTDVRGRLALMSCGAALHHARVVLAAYGWSANVDRRPAAGRLARLHVTGTVPTDLAVVRLAQLMRWRHTDLGTGDGRPPEDGDLAAIGAAVTAQDVGWQPLAPDRMPALARAGHTGSAEPALAQWDHEIAPWSDGPAGSRGTLAVFHGPGDGPANWLRAGEALSAGWLAATGLAVAVLPLSAPALDPRVGDALRSAHAAVQSPYLVVRLTRRPAGNGRPPAPRLPARQLIGDRKA